MEDELLALQERVERLLANARRLSEENLRLRSALADALSGRDDAERRIHEARLRVQAALSHLPGAATDAPH